MKRVLALVVAMSAPAVAAGAPPTLPESHQLIAALEADLLAHPSATDTLQRWCAARHLADPPTIVAQRAAGSDKPADAQVRALLHAAPGETIRYRHVALACGAHVLSNADNWYRPGQLTAQMNVELDTTDHPFGAVVHPLDFHRRSLDAQVLVPSDAATMPPDVIRNRALLETPDGTPFSLVVETYTQEVLGEGR